MIVKISKASHCHFWISRQSYEKLTRLFLQTCNYLSFLKSLVVTGVVTFNLVTLKLKTEKHEQIEFADNSGYK